MNAKLDLPVTARHDEAVEECEIRACNCGAAAQVESRTCPYASEINNSERLCTCCDGCRYQCAMDI